MITNKQRYINAHLKLHEMLKHNTSLDDWSCPLCMLSGPGSCTNCTLFKPGDQSNLDTCIDDNCLDMKTICVPVHHSTNLDRLIRARFHTDAAKLLNRIPAKYFTKKHWDFNRFKGLWALDKKLSKIIPEHNPEVTDVEFEEVT